ncbi:hypothetical protein V6N13_001401 [Hibiscus sabdariffa]|uniref:Uncharacterized protein n=1 Tax=Hibiscus sabdariffa TaxID=183260 RepID=A0ABR2G8Q3_9ROSI
MAKNNLALAAALLIVLLFTSEERVLLADYKALAAVNVTAYDTDDFRPTTPAHNPGAAHSTGASSDDNNYVHHTHDNIIFIYVVYGNWESVDQ